MYAKNYAILSIDALLGRLASAKEVSMLRMINQYCGNCLRTQRFLDLGSYLVCERCSKRLDRVPLTPRRPDGRIVLWVAESRREAM